MINYQKSHALAKVLKKYLLAKISLQNIGLLKSRWPGIGMQFREHKIYSDGDDVRFLDWKILAKTSIPYVKTYQDEKNVEILLVIDTSPSMGMGYKNLSKFQVALEIALVIYLVAQETHYKIHTVFLGMEKGYIPPISAHFGMQFFLNFLQKRHLMDEKGNIQLEQLTSFQNPLPSPTQNCRSLLQIGLKRKQVIFLSDFVHFLPEKFLLSLFPLKGVYGMKIMGPLDREISEQGVSNYPFSLSAKNYRGETAFFFRNPQIKNRKIRHNIQRYLKNIEIQGDYLNSFLKAVK